MQSQTKRTGLQNAEIAQLVEHNLAKVRVASSSLVFRSKKEVSRNADFRFENHHPTGFNHMSVVLVHKGRLFCFYHQPFFRSTGLKKQQSWSSFAAFYVLKRCLELLQETKVILEIIAEVAHLPLEHGNTLNTHTECETAVLLAVNA